jgi:flagellar motor switch protein FliN
MARASKQPPSDMPPGVDPSLLGYSPDMAQPAEEPVVVRPMQFGPLRSGGMGEEPGATLDMLMDVSMRVTVELGRTNMSIRKVLGLTRGSVLELDKLAGEPVDVYVNDTLIAIGEVVVVGEKFGVRVTELASQGRALGALAAG